MGEFYQKKRVDLSKYDSEWEGSFLILKSLTYPEIASYQSKVKKVNKEMERVQMLLDAISEKIKSKLLAYEDYSEHEEEESKLEDILDKASNKVIDLVIDFVAGRVIGGKVRSEKELIEVDRKVIASLPMNVINELQQELLGGIPKKG